MSQCQYILQGSEHLTNSSVTALSLAGCVSTSPSLPDLYLVSFSKNDTTFPEVRLGYFGKRRSPWPASAIVDNNAGICAGNQTTGLQCQATAHASPDAVFLKFPSLFPFLNNTSSSLKEAKARDDIATQIKSLLSTAVILQSQIFIPIIAGAGFLFIVGIVSLTLLKRNLRAPNPDKPKTGQLLKLATLGSFWLSTALAFTASLATSETGGALQYSSLLTAVGNESQPILTKQGMALQVLQWLTFGFTLLFTMSVPWLLRPTETGNVDEKV